MAGIKVGGEVDSQCTRCKMVLAHTVLAVWGGKIKKVRCNTCMGEHAYRPPAGAATSRAKTAAEGPPKRASLSRPDPMQGQLAKYQELVGGRPLIRARPYKLETQFAQGDLLQHPTFGVGVVHEVRGDKIDVVFPASSRTLLHAKGAKPVVAALAEKTSEVVVEAPKDGGLLEKLLSR